MTNSNMAESLGLEPEDLKDASEPEVDEVEVDDSEVEVDEPESEEPEVDESEDEDEQPSPKSYQDPDEEVERARANGWTPYDEYVKKGGDPAKWKTARHFNEYGDMVDKIRHQEQQYEKRFQNLNLLFEAKLQDIQTQRQQLEQQKREAVENGDWDSVQKIDQQLGQNTAQAWQINAQVADSKQEMAQREAKIEDDWMSRNPWVMDAQKPDAPNHQKAVYALQRYQQMMNQGVPVEQRLSALEQELQQRFNQTNPKRDSAPVTDGKQSKRNSGQSLSWGDLTPDEVAEWNKFGQMMFGTKKEYLQVVKDARKSKGAR